MAVAITVGQRVMLNGRRCRVERSIGGGDWVVYDPQANQQYAANARDLHPITEEPTPEVERPITKEESQEADVSDRLAQLRRDREQRARRS